MKLGPNIGRLDPAFNPFDQDYLVEIVDAVLTAWSRMNRPLRSESEDEITNRLAGRLLNDPLFDDLPYDVVPQSWLLGVDGQRLGRIDLRFKHRHSARDYFAFEAKRLHVTYPGGSFRREYGKYTADQGMMCFVVGKYSSGMTAGGMLAYVMDDDCLRAWKGIHRQIEARRMELLLAESSTLAPSSLSQRTKNPVHDARLGDTHHQLDGRALRILHLVLPIGLVVPT